MITNELFNLYLTVRDTIQYYQDVLETGTYFNRNRVLLFWVFYFFCCIRIYYNCLFHYCFYCNKIRGTLEDLLIAVNGIREDGPEGRNM